MNAWLSAVCVAGVIQMCTPVSSKGQQAGAPSSSTIGSIERIDPEIDAIIPADAAIEVLAGGHGWTEGPVWVPELDALLYSDIPASAIYIHRDDAGSTPWIEPSAEYPRGSGGSNGLILNSEGRLLLAQHSDRRVASLESSWEQPVPRFRTLASEFGGGRFNSPNDLVLRRDGNLYFTDPPYGLAGGAEDPAKELDVHGVFRLTVDGEVELIVDDLTRPNGIALSPGEDVLYVANSDEAQPVVMAYNLRPDGSIEEGRVFFESWGDGLAVDQGGNVYIAEPMRGVLIVNSDGVHLGSLLTTQRTSNVAFGGDGSTLYITADSYLMRVELDTKGIGF